MAAAPRGGATFAPTVIEHLRVEPESKFNPAKYQKDDPETMAPLGFELALTAERLRLAT